MDCEVCAVLTRRSLWLRMMESIGTIKLRHVGDLALAGVIVSWSVMRGLAAPLKCYKTI